jgi:hypothetical protein
VRTAGSILRRQVGDRHIGLLLAVLERRLRRHLLSPSRRPPLNDEGTWLIFVDVSIMPPVEDTSCRSRLP